MPSLAAVANRWRTDEFQVWNATLEEFEDGFCGRMFRVDRFKSIYTRPVHRRQITADPCVGIPTDYVVKQVSTGEIYMVSEIRRQDAIDEVLYDGVMTLHLASSSSGGYAELHRYAVAGTGDDLGPLVDTQQPSTYVDLELRTSSADPDTHDEFVGHYFVTTPISSGMEKGDYLHLGTDQYRIDEVYVDSGYLMARVAREAYDKENLTYHLPQGSGGSYNALTGTVTQETIADRIFTGAVVRNEEADMRESDIGRETLTVNVDTDDIGFTPEREHEVTYSGEKYKVDMVVISSNRTQWVLTLRGLT